MKSINITGARGSLVIDDTNAHTGLSNEYINVTEDTVLSVCTGVDSDGNAVNFKTLLNWDGTLTINHNPLTVPRGYKINVIALTSGEIVVR